MTTPEIYDFDYEYSQFAFTVPTAELKSALENLFVEVVQALHHNTASDETYPALLLCEESWCDQWNERIHALVERDGIDEVPAEFDADSVFDSSPPTHYEDVDAHVPGRYCYASPSDSAGTVETGPSTHQKQ